MSSRIHEYWQRLRLIVDKTTCGAMHSGTGLSQTSAAQISQLEPRVLFSATPIDPSMMMGGDDAAAMIAPVDPSEGESSGADQTTDLQSSASQSQIRREVIVIDSNVPHLQQLLDDLSQSGQESSVYVLDAERDGVDQITEILQSHEDLDSLHIVSHAENGAVRLGSTWLSDANLDAYSGQIASWQNALGSDADILLYGCDLAETADGRSLIDGISALSGADVAASVDDTGHASYGGDWDLEYQTGSIETTTAFSSDLEEQWLGKLATITVTTFTDENNGTGDVSLREAIDAATAGDTIDLSAIGAGTFSLTIDTLDIDEDVTLVGLDARSTIIDASALGSRAFHLTATSVVNISGVTVQNGSENNGGAFFVDDTSTLNLSNARLTGNSSNDGGAIHVHGTLNLDSVLLDNNSSSEDGGAIAFHGAVGGSLTNVTISGNNAVSDGGGLWTDSAITITNSTITLNHGFQGGGIYKFGGAVDISNTIVAGNTADSALKDVRGGFNSSGFNLIEVVSSATGFENDITGFSANLAALSNNGGQTDSHALQAGSLAINTGAQLNSANLDQRGLARNSISDIGAFELTTATTAKIYWNESSSGSIFRANEDGTAIQEIVTGRDATAGLEVDVARGFIYWINTDTNQLYRSDLDGSNIYIGSTVFSNPAGLGIDLVNNLVYVADNGGGVNNAIYELDEVGGTTTRLVDNISGTVRDVAIDSTTGLIYFSTDRGSAFSGEIQTFDTVGANGQRSFITGEAGPQSLEIDAANGKIYWADDGDLGVNRIRQADLSDGANKSNVDDSGLNAPFGLDINTTTGRVYWTDSNNNFIRSQSLSGGASSDIITTGLDGPREIVVATVPGTNNDPTVVNPIADQTATEDAPFNFQFPGNVFGDSDGDTLSFTATLADGAALPTWLTFTAATRTFSGTPENDDVGIITIRVTADDGKFGTVDDQFTLTVQNTNDSPTDITLTNSRINENSDGATVGSVGVVDPDDGDTHTLSVDDSRFQIVGTTLKLRAGQTLNHETESTVDLIVTATDQAGSGTAFAETFTITIDDVNESPTDITLSNASLDENTDGATVGTVGVVDPDDGDTHTFSVNDSRFQIVGTTLKLRTGQTLNHETDPTIDVIVTATDQAGAGIPFAETFTITIDDVNESPTDIALSNDSLDENIDGATVGTIGVVDPDDGDTHTLSVNDSRFEIVGTTLKLRAGQTLNHETEPTVDLIVTATDQAGAGTAFAETFTITIDDINESPTDITLSNASVNENTDSETVGTVGVVDPDDGDTHTFGVDDSRFEIVGTALRLRAGQSLDSETEPTVDVIVTATDQAGSGLALAETFTITVNDLNEAPTVSVTNITASVSENADTTNSTKVADITVSDTDAGTNTLSLSGADANLFELRNGGTELHLQAGTILDFETNPTLDVTVEVDDATITGSPDDSQSLTIAVTDANDAPDDIQLDNTTVSENDPGGVVGNVVVSDVDSGDSHAWTIDDSRFEVVGGQLRLKPGVSLDAETEPTLNLALTATDQGGTGIGYTESFVVTVNDVNETPVATQDSFQANGNGVFVSGRSVLNNDNDPESAPTVASLATSTANGRLVFNTDGTFSYTPNAGFTGTDSFEYQISDGTLLSDPTLVLIEVTSLGVIPELGTGDTFEQRDEETDEDETEESEEEESALISELAPEITDTRQTTTNREQAEITASITEVEQVTAASFQSQSRAFANLVAAQSRQANEGTELKSAGNASESDTRKSDRSRERFQRSELDYALLTSPGVMWNELDQQRTAVESQIQGDLIVVGAAGFAASGFTVGIAAWAMRTGLLAYGLLTQVPAWKSLDPLLVMQGLGETGDEQSLQEMMDQRIQALDQAEQNV